MADKVSQSRHGPEAKRPEHFPQQQFFLLTAEIERGLYRYEE